MLRSWFVALSTTGVILAAPVRASDYSNSCTSVDKVWVIEDGTLFAARDKDRKTALTYAIVEEQVLKESRGFCLPSNPEAKGAKYANQFRKSRQTIHIDVPGGARRTATVVCELAASGLPAAFNCDRSETTLDRKTPGPVQKFALGTPGTWTHNGSIMKIEADGATRRIVYMNPRDGIRQVGVSGGEILFDGERKGNSFEGTASWFSKSCGRQTFPVRGTVNADESRIELAGEAQRLDPTCKQSGARPERLVFERVRG